MKIDFAGLEVKTFLCPHLTDQDTIISDLLDMLSGFYYCGNNCMSMTLKNRCFTERHEMREFSFVYPPEITTITSFWFLFFSWLPS
jgi:hypothetical protein